MYRRTYNRNRPVRNRRGLGAYLRRPSVQLLIVLVAAVVVYLIALAGGSVPSVANQAEVNVDEALTLFQNNVYVLDVSWAPEYAEYHLPNSVNIPLDILFQRMNELPKDRQILVMARLPQSAQQARDLLKDNGFNAVSMSASTAEWYVKGYPIDGAPPQ